MGRRRTAVGALALVALLALAGCGSTAGGGTPEAVTPAPVPTLEPTLVPGVAEEAIDADRLMTRHENALQGASFTMTRRFRARLPDGDVAFEANTRITRGPDGRFLYRRVVPTEDRPFANNVTEIWWDGNRSRYRYTEVSGSVDTITFGRRPIVDLDQSYAYDKVLSGLAVTHAQGVPDGGARLTGRLSNASAVPTTGGIEDPRNASATIRIRENGLIEAVAVSYGAEYRGNRTDVRFTVGFEYVGSSTVEPPAWGVD